MEDGVQAFLLAWQSNRNEANVEHWLGCISNEWRPRVRQFLRHADSDEVEDWLADAIEALVLREAHGGGCRALAPVDAQSPAAWRRRVLRNHLISQHRMRSRRSHAEWAEQNGICPVAEKSAWRRLSRGVSGNEPSPDVRGVEGDAGRMASDATPETLSLGIERRAVMRAAVHLAVRRAVTFLLALRADPTHLADSLAVEIVDQVDAVLHRMHIARTSELDGVHEYLSMAMVRVCWPNEVNESKALDSARKALQRAIADLQSNLTVRK